MLLASKNLFTCLLVRIRDACETPSTCLYMNEQSLNHIDEKMLDPLHRTHFGQYQASSARNLGLLPHAQNVLSMKLFCSLLLYPEKAELFLELFGNSLLRAQTADYLRLKANDLIK